MVYTVCVCSSSTRAGHRDEVLFDNPIYEMGLVGSDGKKPSGEGDGASESEATKTREREAIAILRSAGRNPFNQ